MNSKEFIYGLKRTFPLMIGVVPFGLAYGVMGIEANLSVSEITLMSMVVFAGSAQFMAVGMINVGTSLFVIVMSTLLINLRHLLMGLSLSPYLKYLEAKWLYLLSFGMVDESYATTISHYENAGKDRGEPWFMLGSAVGMYVFWIGSSFVGAILGSSIDDPLSWGLDFAMPATFLSLVVPQIKSIRMLAVFVVSGAIAIFSYLLVPGKWYIIIATVSATIVGTMLELSLEKRRVEA